jgi:hypothetical protein
MADDFEKFKKMYKDGEVKMLANPPPMPGPSGVAVGAARGAVMTKGRKFLMDKLEKSRQAGAKARNTFRKDSGTMASKIDKAKATRPSTPRDGEKFGALVKRGDNLPAKQGSRAVTPYKEGSKGVTKYKPQGGAVAKIGSKVADKGSGSRIGNILKYGAVGAAVGGAGYGLYEGADKTKAEGRKDTGRRIIYSEPAGPKAPKANSKLTGGARDDRASSGSSKAKSFRDKQQGMKVDGSPTNPNKAGPKKATPKAGEKAPANKAEKPMSSFERMKKRQYEKEGYGGRSLTSRGAESRVKKERSYKFKDLFKKKK